MYACPACGTVTCGCSVGALATCVRAACVYVQRAWMHRDRGAACVTAAVIMKQKKSDGVLEEVVDFFCNPEITRYRTQNRQRLFERYEALAALKPPSERIGRTLFYQIGNAITAPDLKVCNGALSSCRNLQYVHMD